MVAHSTFNIVHKKLKLFLDQHGMLRYNNIVETQFHLHNSNYLS